MRMYVPIALLLMIPFAQGTFQPSHGPDIWFEAGLDMGYAKKFINNPLCAKNATWFRACHQAIEKALALLDENHLQSKAMSGEWREQSSQPDFEKWLLKIDQVPDNNNKSMMFGLMVNEHLSAFDAHAKILPVDLLKQMLGQSNETNLKSEIINHLNRKFAFMKISVFREGICEMVEAELQILISVGADGLILDLRGNGGGSNEEARCVYRLLDGARLPITRKYFAQSLLPTELDLRPTTLFRNRTPDQEGARTPPSSFTKIPLVVLVNGKSGSVTELVSAGFQDTHRAWIVGEPTFGKGTFQVTQELHFHDKLRLMHSVYEIFRTGGAPIQYYGVTPNFTVPLQVGAAARPILRERDLFPAPLRLAPVWKETRAATRNRLRRCASRQTKRSAADYQQAFAMGVLHCARIN